MAFHLYGQYDMSFECRYICHHYVITWPYNVVKVRDITIIMSGYDFNVMIIGMTL